jgi:hypothetical protein
MAIGQLVVRIVGDNSQLSKDLTDAGQKTEAFATKGRSAINSFGKAAVASFAAVGAAAAAAYIKTAAEVDNLAKTADRLGIGVEALQALRFAAEQTGATAEQLDKGLVKLTKGVSEAARGTGEAAQAFKLLNIDAKTLIGLSPDQQFNRIADAVQGLGSQSDRVSVAMRLFGEEGTALINTMSGGSAAVSALTDEAKLLGLTLSRTDAAKVEQANDAIGRINTMIKGGLQVATAEFAPIVAALADEFKDLVLEAGGFGPMIGRAMDYGVKVVGVFANGLRGINIIVKGLELGFEAFGFAINRIFLAASRSIDWLINGAIGNINKLIEGVNNIPGVGIAAIEQFTSMGTKFFEENTQYWSDAMVETMAEMHDLAMLPLPSEGVEAWVEQVKAKAQEAAEAVAAAQQGLAPSGVAAVPGMSDEELAQLEKRVEAIRQSTLTERELMLEKYEMDLEDLKLARENKLLTDEEYNALELDRFINHMDELGAIEQEAAAKRQAVLDQERQAKLNVVQGMFSNLSTLMNTGSRKLFEIGKAASIANALVSGYEAVVSSYAAGAKIGGPPVGAAFAATAAAATFAQIQQIRAASFGQKSAPVTFDGGIPTQATSQAGAQGPQGGGAGRNVSISLVGESFSRDQVRGLIDAFNTELNDGYKLTVSGG